MEIEKLSIDSLTFDASREYRFAKLQFKVARFAMNKITENTIISMDKNFVPKGEDCNCWDRIRYLLPCPCLIHGCPDILPLDIVYKRWRFEEDEGKCKPRFIVFLVTV